MVLTVLTVFPVISNAALCKARLSPNYGANHLFGKMALVTGATFGIGKETALGLAKQGAQVVIVGRDLNKTKEVVEWVKVQSGNPQITYLIADLSLLKQVKSLADQFKSLYPRLDILVNNAGAVFAKKELTSENIEKTWALNHLSPLLLTLELVDSLKASGKARVVNVTSALYEKGNINFDLSEDKKFKGLDAYGDSKLAAMLVSFNLAKNLQGTGISINCLHPGFVDTGIGANNGGFVKILLTAAQPIKKFLSEHTNYMMTPEEGAQTSIYLASSNEVNGVTGKYFYKNAPLATTDKVQDEGLKKKVWNLSLQQIKDALNSSTF